MRRIDHEGLTLLELVLQLQGDFRMCLKPIRVTPLQAGMILFLHRHANATLTDAATALRIGQPTVSVLVKDLVRKRWVIKRRSVKDRRAVSLRLSRQGQTLALQIEQWLPQVSATLTEQDRRALGINPQGNRT